jgi:hypothetical protein
MIFLVLTLATDSKPEDSGENAFAQGREKFQHPEGEARKAGAHVQLRSPRG